MKKIGAESFCVLPLTTTVRPIGAMAFGSSSPRAFEGSELDFLQLVVKQVAVAVDNVLHDESATAVQAAIEPGTRSVASARWRCRNRLRHIAT